MLLCPDADHKKTPWKQCVNENQLLYLLDKLFVSEGGMPTSIQYSCKIITG